MLFLQVSRPLVVGHALMSSIVLMQRHRSDRWIVDGRLCWFLRSTSCGIPQWLYNHEGFDSSSDMFFCFFGTHQWFWIPHWYNLSIPIIRSSEYFNILSLGGWLGFSLSSHIIIIAHRWWSQVLSVIAQQILCIQNAIRVQGLKLVFLERC